jgi:hypothetical protein
MTKPDIKDIPQEFVINNLTQYQKEIIGMKYVIYQRYLELRKKNKPKLDIYMLIADEVGLQWETVHKFVVKIYRQK